MKPFVIILTFALCAVRCAALSLTNGINGHVLLSWGCDTNDITPDLTFRLYDCTNLNALLAQWNLLTNVCVTNFAPYQVQQIISGTNGNFTTNYYATNFTAA